MSISSRTINRAENWERVYGAFQQINFSAFDYNTIKQSLIDYLKIYYPEDFNDFTENSDMIVVIEMFAYISELYAYRLDVNAHENFLQVAERKESVLRLVKLISYSPKRNLPARGLVKINSVITTERVLDSRGTDLSNKNIYWNDSNNPNWKEQFILVVNTIMDQPFGTVLPSDRVQVENSLFELYPITNSVNGLNVTYPFTTSVSGKSYVFEVVSSNVDEFGPFERRPEKNTPLNFIFMSDGLGDSSINTGFFFMIKQGRLQRQQFTFDGITPNQSVDVLVENCNETDIWLNNIDPNSGQIIVSNDIKTIGRTGEWERVDIANSQNVIFNTNPNRNKFEIETLAVNNKEDMLRIVFGDGKFSNIPSGTFELWYRVSANEDVTFPINSIQNIGTTFTYRGLDEREHTFTCKVSLVQPLQNSVSSETVDHIKRIAPAVYYTQDRMVNGKDYNEFPLQDNSILKLRAINRTFSGDSKYIPWHDPREFYENVKIFGDDLVIYFDNVRVSNRIMGSEVPVPDGGANISLVTALIYNHLEPLIASSNLVIRHVQSGLDQQDIRNVFTDDELIILRRNLTNIINNRPNTIYLTFDAGQDRWIITNIEPTDYWISLQSTTDGGYIINVNAIIMKTTSPTTKFWVTNNEKTITYDTYNSNFDKIYLLKANLGAYNNILDRNYGFNIRSQDIIDVGENIGTPKIDTIIVIPEDTNLDGYPDDLALSFLLTNRNNTFVYFNRDNLLSPWRYVPYNDELITILDEDQNNGTNLWKREVGVEGLNFLWTHRTPRYHLVDPASSNIIDWFVITRSYYFNIRLWLNDITSEKPIPPTTFQLRQDYKELIDNKMISDTLIIHPGNFKIILGKKAIPELQANIKIIRSNNKLLTNNQLKVKVVDLVSEFFDINVWEFGETFYFSELATFIHSRLPVEVDSVVLVPRFNTQVFGDLQQISVREDEIIQPHITVDEIELVESLNPKILKQIL